MTIVDSKKIYQFQYYDTATLQDVLQCAYQQTQLLHPHHYLHCDSVHLPPLHMYLLCHGYDQLSPKHVKTFLIAGGCFSEGPGVARRMGRCFNSRSVQIVLQLIAYGLIVNA